MARAKQETCPHPFKSLERVAYGRYRCSRCDADRTPPERVFEVRHSERVMLTCGDRIAVNSKHHSGAFQGIFLWCEDFPSGRAYVVAETQTWTFEKKLLEDWAAIRHVQPEHVARAPGYRDRKAREEIKS